MSDNEEIDEDILDLRKVEDVFACLESVAMAQAVLMGMDPDTGSMLEKVTEALGALTLVIEQGELVQQVEVEKVVEVEKIVEVERVVEKEVAVPAPSPAKSTGSLSTDDLVDFVNATKPQSDVATPKPADEDNDAIIDILTGERIN